MFNQDYGLCPKTYSIKSYKKRKTFKNLRAALFYGTVFGLIGVIGFSVFYFLRLL